MTWLDDPERLRRIARIWCIVAGALLLAYLAGEFRVGWTDGKGHPFGEDFLNIWSAGRLAFSGEAARIYDIAGFHAFEQSVVGAPIDLYHASYPPVSWLLTAPFAALPYLAGWLLWQGGGWLAFALALRRIAPGDAILIALALPAVTINAIGGQNGCWTAAMIGWGLILLDRRPWLAGAVLALFVVKPQLGWLIPLALLAGGERKALAGFLLAAVALLALSVLLFGVQPWLAYLAQAKLLKHVILEDGAGTWHRMISIFVLLRHVGATLPVAYGGQAIASGAAALLVAWIWRREGASDHARALLVATLLAGSLYVSDYDMVMLALPACWMWPGAGRTGRALIAATAVTPLFAATLALASHLAMGAVALWLVPLWIARRALPPQPEIALA